jgi:hypothetical protein
MANLATYPAVAVPNGFNAAGLPTSITFCARPFGESELLAVVKAYQDATGFHLQHPGLTYRSTCVESTRAVGPATQSISSRAEPR